MEMSLNQRIRIVRQFYCNGNNAEFSRILGKPQNQTSNWCSDGFSVGSKTIALICEKFPDVNYNWLCVGAGEMSKSKNVTIALPKEEKKEECNKNYVCGVSDAEFEKLKRMVDIISDRSILCEKYITDSHAILTEIHKGISEIIKYYQDGKQK